MPKIMYAAKMDLATKCPSCQTEITSIGNALYACRSGHVIECVVMVTIHPKTTTLTEEKPKAEQRDIVVTGTRPS